MTREQLRQSLMEKIIERIKYDLSIGDVLALEELISYVPIENQVYYLDEEEWGDYKKLL